MYDCLVRWVDNPAKLQLWLAERIDIAPDGVTYTVAIKPGAKFHDGSAITADDVVFSMERILSMKQGAYGLFKGVIDPGKTKALDAHTVQFTLNQPFAVFTSILSELWVVNSKLLRRARQVGRHRCCLACTQRGGLWRIQAAPLRSGHRLPGGPVSTEHFAGFGNSNITTTEFRVVLETASRALGSAEGRVQHDRRLPAAGPDQAAAAGRQRADPRGELAANDVLRHPQCAAAVDRCAICARRCATRSTTTGLSTIF